MELIAFALISLATALVWVGFGSHGVEPVLFQKKVWLTDNEMEFLLRLERAVPEFRFHAQVAMGALLNPTVSRFGRGKEYFRLRSQFSQKIVDFVAQRRDDGKIVAVIELDDRTHDTQKDAQRDKMLLQAGYRVMRWHSRRKPDLQTIRHTLLDTLIESGPTRSAVV